MRLYGRRVPPAMHHSPRRVAIAAGLASGFLVDALVGDPRRLHPVAGFGTVAGRLERQLYRDSQGAGALFAAAAVVPFVTAALALDRLTRDRPGIRFGLVTATTWAVLGGQGLRRAGTLMASSLDAGDLAACRGLVPTLCGRDPDSLDADGIGRATVESIAENTSDSVVAPLFWGAIAGLPGLVGYRAVNTLDAMVGHRSSRYARFGTASARLDDVANYVPARLTAALTVLAAPAVGGSPGGGIAAWQADAAKHPSPNAGRCEAAMAGVLGVRLGGRTVYGERAENRPTLGTGPAPSASDIERAARVSGVVGLAAAVFALLGALRPRRVWL